MNKIYSKFAAIDRINELSSHHEPFFFMINYDQSKTVIVPRSKLYNQDKIRFSIPGFDTHSLQNDSHDTGTSTSFLYSQELSPDFYFDASPLSFEEYFEKYEKVRKEIENGNTYLLNLTAQTPVNTNLHLSEIYRYSTAKYKLFYDNQFTVFSPETFITIQNETVKTFPMKGTINADLPQARQELENNQKEMAEHASIVDLLRNDLGTVSENIKINRFRYFEHIQTSHKNLWQVSSEIEGSLPQDYIKYLGTILFRLLPAGSVTGVPKKKTLDIIQKSEGYERGFYTGVFGYFDGQNLDSGVMIRFIENNDNQLWYKSGGGIHALSNPQEEYDELINKIYVPILRKHLYKE